MIEPKDRVLIEDGRSSHRLLMAAFVAALAIRSETVESFPSNWNPKIDQHDNWRRNGKQKGRRPT